MLESPLWTQYKKVNVQFLTVYEPNYMSIIHYQEIGLKVNCVLQLTQSHLCMKSLMLSVLKKGNKIRKDKLKELHQTLQKLCEHNGVEDKPEQYTDTMKKILRLREILDL